MSKNILVDLSMDFSVDIVNMCDGIKGKAALTNQLLRSGTSIGANIHEANYGASRQDFINKLQIALKECIETEYWIEMLSGCGAISEEISRDLLSECGVIHRMLVKSINTAKENG